MNYAGFLIRQKRLEKGWSQEGLCRGVCAVSYLSKIEQGKADGSDEIVGELMRRLGCGWFNDENDRARAAEAVECGYEAMMSLDTDALCKAVEKAKSDPLFLNGPYALDFLLQGLWLSLTQNRLMTGFRRVLTHVRRRCRHTLRATILRRISCIRARCFFTHKVRTHMSAAGQWRR